VPETHSPLQHCKTMTNTDDETPKTEPAKSGLKPWRKGESGNPHGRRAKGLATAEKLRNALVKDLPAILEAVVTKAKAGDVVAARTILERVLAPLKPIEPTVVMGSMTGTLAEQGQTILAAMAAGLLAPGQAVQLIGAIAAQAKIVEVDDLARRIAELEKANAQQV
jgi:hypothetical protein